MCDLINGDWVNSGVPDESLSPRIRPVVCILSDFASLLVFPSLLNLRDVVTNLTDVAFAGDVSTANIIHLATFHKDIKTAKFGEGGEGF